jgi:hypothetical protein
MDESEPLCQVQKSDTEDLILQGSMYTEFPSRQMDAAESTLMVGWERE